jgi:hypothetical protein
MGAIFLNSAMGESTLSGITSDVSVGCRSTVVKEVILWIFAGIDTFNADTLAGAHANLSIFSTVTLSFA